jgi:phage-related baseplate assembly protein
MVERSTIYSALRVTGVADVNRIEIAELQKDVALIRFPAASPTSAFKNGI